MNSTRAAVGRRLSQVERPSPWRHAVNLAAVSRLRARHRSVQLPVVPPYPKLFVVGCPRSGTSWVQDIVARHPLVITGKESHAYPYIHWPVVRRGDRESIAAWTEVLQSHDTGARAKHSIGLHWWIDREQLLRLIEWAFAADGVSAEDAADTVIEGVFNALFVAHGGDEHHTLLEKSPNHINYAGRILRRFPEARVVEVLRDGRDVCVSMQMRALKRGWVPQSRTEQIGVWADAARRGLELRADPEIADRVLSLRYEDLKRAPEETIARLFEFARLDEDEAFVSEVAELSDFRHLQTTGAGRQNRRGEIGDWQDHFSADDEALFRDLAGDVFEAVGYRF